jgi:two-component system chemotaxis response regulator CheY
MRSLVVDDDYISRLKLKNILAEYGDCDAVPTGTLALEMFEAAYKELVPYDLVSTDINMPGMGGLALIRKIRKIEMDYGTRLQNTVKILAVTVKQDSGTVLSSVKEGCEYYLVKPVTPENVSHAIEKLGLQEEEFGDDSMAPGLRDL